MGEMGCQRCGKRFDPHRHPVCTPCLVEDWLATESFVREKHDPRLLPMAWEGYRSVLNPNLVASPRPYLEYAAEHGRWYRDVFYEMYIHMTTEPLGVQPGSGIPEGRKQPEHALDSLLIVEANSKTQAHAFAVAREQFEAQIRAGEFVPLEPCFHAGCDGLRVPGQENCAQHAAIEGGT